MLDKWANIYETTAFFAGVSDDVSPFDTMGIVYEIYGANPNYKAALRPLGQSGRRGRRG